MAHVSKLSTCEAEAGGLSGIPGQPPLESKDHLKTT